MRPVTGLFFALCAIAAVSVEARKPCDELKAEIASRIDANGVRHYTLSVVPVEAVGETDGKIVGRCDGGSQRIVYRRGESAPQPAIAQHEPTR